MLRRCTGLLLALFLTVAPLASSLAPPVSAQNGSPIAVAATSTTESIANADRSDDAVFAAEAAGNTPASASPQLVFVLPDLYITFAAVTVGGNTTAVPLNPADAPPLPDGLRSDNARIVQIETTATVQYAMLVCLIYDATAFADPGQVALLWFDGSAWIDITDSGNSSVAGATVCGYVSSLGLFAAAEPGSNPTTTPTDIPLPTETPTLEPSDTPVPTETPTPSPTGTPSPVPTDTPTASATASSTEIELPTSTSTPSWTPTSTPSDTPPPTVTESATATETTTATESPAPSATASPTATASPSPTRSATATPTTTTTATESPTLTPTVRTERTQFALPNVWVTYTDALPADTTTGDILDGTALPPVPLPYATATAWFFSVTNSENPTGNKQVCVLFSATSFSNPAAVALLRLQSGSWTPLTNQLLTDLDTTQGTICGITPALGTFALVERLPATATATATLSRTATATATMTASRTATAPPTATSTPSPTPTATSSPSPLPTETTTPSPTATPTATPTLAPGSYPVGADLRATTRVNLRSGPSTSTTSLGVIDKDVVVTVQGASVFAGDRFWVPVSTPDLGSGWIAGDYLVPVPTPTPTSAPPAATSTQPPATGAPTQTPTRPAGGFIDGDFVRTTASLNLRAGPGTSYQIRAVLPKGATGEITGAGVTSSSITFYPVLFEGYPAGYVAGNYLQLITSLPTARPTVSPTPTLAGVPIRFTTSNVNMRTGPGTSYRIIATLPKGTRVSVTGTPRRSGGYDWYPIAVYGIGNGWVAGKFLSITGPI